MQNKAFNNFGEGSEIRNRPVVGGIEWVKVRFF